MNVKTCELPNPPTERFVYQYHFLMKIHHVKAQIFTLHWPLITKNNKSCRHHFTVKIKASHFLLSYPTELDPMEETQSISRFCSPNILRFIMRYHFKWFNEGTMLVILPMSRSRRVVCFTLTTSHPTVTSVVKSWSDFIALTFSLPKMWRKWFGRCWPYSHYLLTCNIGLDLLLVGIYSEPSCHSQINTNGSFILHNSISFGYRIILCPAFCFENLE